MKGLTLLVGNEGGAGVSLVWRAEGVWEEEEEEEGGLGVGCFGGDGGGQKDTERTESLGGRVGKRKRQESGRVGWLTRFARPPRYRRPDRRLGGWRR